MGSTLAIGDFSRATHLSVKKLRHYHQIGLLEPADVDPETGYRHYATEQISAAQVIRRFRELDMPLDEIHAVLSAPDPQTRNALIADHLARMEAGLTRTQAAIAALRDLLEHPNTAAPIEHRRVEAAAAAAITEVIDIADALLWYQGALGELHALLAAQDIRPDGPPGATYSSELFADERGSATIFVPCQGQVRPMGRVVPLVVPAVELATITHTGPHNGIDRAYGALATYVSDHALAVDGPIREYYLVGPGDTPEETAWRTQIGWPVFATSATT
ncbi:MerR family transcriptional regulator [Rhodococcus koreensis]|uniref:MerR family transcriptional regulator n=1 Tax=Rhodococcus koreensis TaxID=99653 RepID=UPI0019811B28|nr:MerR family transcriptional regulator [Rhodococcus koreensis]QSE77696.1 MerR family transcriptional regulator [Rhodococcus koreensis]